MIDCKNKKSLFNTTLLKISHVKSSCAVCIYDYIFAYCLHLGHDEVSASPVEAHANNTAGYCLTLPGRKLYLTPLLGMKKFRKHGNKDGVAAFYQLEEDGLGRLLELQGSKGTTTVSFKVISVSIRLKLLLVAPLE